MNSPSAQHVVSSIQQIFLGEFLFKSIEPPRTFEPFLPSLKEKFVNLKKGQLPVLPRPSSTFTEKLTPSTLSHNETADKELQLVNKLYFKSLTN